MKNYKHGWGRHTSGHGTAVYVLPAGGEEEKGFRRLLLLQQLDVFKLQSQYKKSYD